MLITSPISLLNSFCDRKCHMRTPDGRFDLCFTTRTGCQLRLRVPICPCRVKEVAETETDTSRYHCASTFHEVGPSRLLWPLPPRRFPSIRPCWSDMQPRLLRALALYRLLRLCKPPRDRCRLPPGERTPSRSPESRGTRLHEASSQTTLVEKNWLFEKNV